MSVDVVENKRTKNVTFRRLSMLMSPKDLPCASGLALDVDENKLFVLCCGNVSSTSVDVYEKSAS